MLKITAALSYSDSSIVGGQNYYYKVTAYYKSGSTTINGRASDVVLQVGTLKKVSLRVKIKEINGKFILKKQMELKISNL